MASRRVEPISPTQGKGLNVPNAKKHPRGKHARVAISKAQKEKYGIANQKSNLRFALQT